MDTNFSTFSVTDLRHRTSMVLAQVKQKGIVYVLSHSRSEAALVDIAYLSALQQAYEDLIDIREFDASIGLKRIPLQTHIKSMKP